MCGVLSISFPEGQHRAEAASHPLFGFPLLGPAPLEQRSDDVGAETYKARAPQGSTIHNQIGVEVIVLTDVHRVKFQPISESELGEISNKLQEQVDRHMPTTYFAFYSNAISQIDSALATSPNRQLELNY